MPSPQPDETRDEFLQRCIPIVVGEGKKSDQAVAICSSMWGEERKDHSFLEALHLDVDFGDTRRTLVVANTSSLRLRGLNGVESLDVDGMLFVYDQDVFVPFTAERTRIPLVLAFYDEDGNLLGSELLQPGTYGPFWPLRAFRYAVEMHPDDFVEGPLRVVS